MKHSKGENDTNNIAVDLACIFFQSMARLENFRFRYAELKGFQFTGLLKNSLWIILSKWSYCLISAAPKKQPEQRSCKLSGLIRIG